MPAASPPIDQPQFVHRIVRIIALVLLAYAALHVVQGIIALVVHGGWPWGYMGMGAWWIGRAIELAHAGNVLLLGIGAAALLAWKPWGRTAVMLWAILYIVLHFASSAFWVVEYARQIAAAPATQAVRNQSVWQYMLMFGFSWLANALFPLLVWLILREPEVVSLFARAPQGGFEVVPLAQAVRLPAPVGGGPAAGADSR